MKWNTKSKKHLRKRNVYSQHGVMWQTDAIHLGSVTLASTLIFFHEGSYNNNNPGTSRYHLILHFQAKQGQTLTLLLQITSEICLYFPQKLQSNFCYRSKQFWSSTAQNSIPHYLSILFINIILLYLSLTPIKYLLNFPVTANYTVCNREILKANKHFSFVIQAVVLNMH
jgi:hypothetical protein